MTLSDPAVYLSLLVFLPAIAALVLALLPRLADESYKLISLAVTIFVFILTLGFFMTEGLFIKATWVPTKK